ncbi:hypothetical protein [Ruminococcus sp.]|uniref:hypothetical protein n=1 Tax=Ruminococcus sp. TaxID=41978 RepID=UPI001B0322F1|nr:hypothetical protein [Ruminococcus sp.]MBO5558436.1 hypothetical protein [Ruminococcus sp.]
MTELFGSYCARMFRHKLYIFGLAAAFIITYFISANGAEILPLHNINNDLECAKLASLGIPAFFSLFTAVFLGAEYFGGAIRNKLICGRTRREIYFASFGAVTLGMLIMIAVWAAAALLGAHVLPDGSEIASCIVRTVFYDIANLSVLVLVSMNIEKEVLSAAVAIMSFQASFMAVILMQAIMGIAGDGIGAVLRALINVIPYGQWLSMSLIGDTSIAFTAPVQIVISAVSAVIITAAGLHLMEKKDIR